MPTSVHIPKPLLAAVDRRARHLRISRNKLIVQALEREISSDTVWSPGFFDELRKITRTESRAVDELLDAVVTRRSSKTARSVTYVLDTNCVSALMRGDERVIAHLERVQKENVAVPQPVLAEIAYGIERLGRSKRRDFLSNRFARIGSELARASWDDAVSEHFGALKALLERRGDRIDDFDAAIAAHALARGAVLVTANVRHLARVPGLVVEDWTAS